MANGGIAGQNRVCRRYSQNLSCIALGSRMGVRNEHDVRAVLVAKVSLSNAAALQNPVPGVSEPITDANDPRRQVVRQVASLKKRNLGTVRCVGRDILCSTVGGDDSCPTNTRA